MNPQDKILYHFTGPHHVRGCLREGLTRGSTLFGTTQTKYYFLHNTQWLTSNPDFHQSWNEFSTLPYDRTANRLTICIPSEFLPHLHRWQQFGQRVPPAIYNLLSAYGDPENWFIYQGTVPPEWIVDCVKKNQ